VANRERLASGLAAGAAAVSLTYAGTVAGANSGPPDFLLAFSDALMALYLVVAPLAAIVLVSITRGVDARVRWAVWLLAIASAAPLGRLVLDFGQTPGNLFMTRGTVVYGAALVLIVVAAGLLSGYLRWAAGPARRRPLATIAGAVIALAAVGAGLANLVGLLAAQRANTAALVDEVARSSAADGAALAASAAETEITSALAVAVWAVVAVGGVVVMAVVGLVRGSTALSSVARPATAVCVLFVSHASVTMFAQLMSYGGSGYLPIPDLLLEIGRWGLIAIALLTVGGLRFERRAPRRASA
jgi:hypothetical protein